MYYARTAYELASQVKNHLYIARSAEMIADNYMVIYDSTNAVSYYREAAKEYELSGKNINHLFSLCDMAIADYPVNPQQSYIILDSVAKIAIRDGIENLEGYALYDLTEHYVQVKDLEGFNQFLEFDKKNEFLSDHVPLMLSYARLHIFRGDYEKARQIMDTLPPLQFGSFSRSVMYWNRVFIDRAEHNDKMLIADLESIMSNESARFELTFRNSIYEEDKKYFSDEAAMAKLQAANAKYRYSFIIVSIIFIVIVVGAVLWKFWASSINRLKSLYLTSRKKNDEDHQELSLLREDIVVLENLLKISKEENTRRESEFRELYRSNWRTVTELCEFYYESKQSGKDIPKIVKTLEKQLNKLIDEKNLDCLKKVVDSNFGNVISEYISKIDTMTDDDILLYALLAAGFSKNSLMFYFKIENVHALYKRRTRIIEKIKNSNLQDKKKIIDMISLKL